MNFASTVRRRCQPGRLRLWALPVALVAALLLPVRLLVASPLITDQPDPQSVSTGAQVVFTVTAESASPAGMIFQWRRNGVDIPGATTIRPGPTATVAYLVAGVEPPDCGIYSVVVSDADGAVNSEAVSLLVTNIPVLPVNDSFEARGQLGLSTGGAGRADNFGASKEPGEADHAGKRGGASVWLQWTAPFNGIATFRTLGSGLDTTLGVYSGSKISDLVPLIDDDDEAGFLNSVVRFNAVQFQNYNIAMDGYYGAKGDLILGWQLEPANSPVPVIQNHPVGQTVAPGTDVSFDVAAAAGLPVTYQWFLNGNPLPGQTDNKLTILSVGPQNVGTYRVRLQAGANPPRDTFSRGATLQINTTPGGGNTNAAAMRKFREAVDPTTGPSLPARHAGGGKSALASGFTGTQIFNTTGAVKEPGEPNHCNEAGGASFWFSYQAPAGGTLSVNTTGTAFNSILAVYTGAGDSFASLVPVACSSTNSAGGAEAVSFVVTNAQTNYIVVDGIGGASGLVFLNYNLASPPVITSQPVSRSVAESSNVTLNVTATGMPVLGYRWRSNSVFLASRTNSFLTLTNFQAGFEAGYDVVVTNSVGSVTSSVAWLYLNTPLRFTNITHTSNRTVSALLIGRAFTNYVIQSSTNLADPNWLALRTNNSSVGLIPFADTNTPAFSNRFFRARSQ